MVPETIQDGSFICLKAWMNPRILSYHIASITFQSDTGKWWRGCGMLKYVDSSFETYGIIWIIVLHAVFYQGLVTCSQASQIMVVASLWANLIICMHFAAFGCLKWRIVLFFTMFGDMLASLVNNGSCEPVSKHRFLQVFWCFRMQETSKHK